MKLKTSLHFILLSSFLSCFSMEKVNAIFPVSKLPRDLQIQIFSEFLTVDPRQTIIDNLQSNLMEIKEYEIGIGVVFNPFQKKLFHDRISYLIKRGYSRKDINQTFLLLAKLNLKQKDIIKIFLDAGANINARNIWGTTAIMWASEKCNAELVEILLDFKADVNSRNKFGNNALIWAAWVNNVNIARKLINAGADYNAQNTYGDTALMTVAWKGNVALARLLIDSGTDIYKQNNRGFTALMFAKEHGRRKIVKLLKKKIKEGKPKKRCSVM